MALRSPQRDLYSMEELGESQGEIGCLSGRTEVEDTARAAGDEEDVEIGMGAWFSKLQLLRMRLNLCSMCMCLYTCENDVCVY